MFCPTVKIQSDNDDGYVVINESDFDDSKHSLFVPVDPEAKRLADEEEAQRLADEAKRLAEEAKRPVLTAHKKAK